MVKLSTSGDFKKLTKFLNGLTFDQHIEHILKEYGEKGVEALRAATPKNTGKTSESWDFKVYVGDTSASITWTNSNLNEGVPIALMIQYGHAMPQGTYVQGIDYINPAMKPIFEEITEKVWKEVSK